MKRARGYRRVGAAMLRGAAPALLVLITGVAATALLVAGLGAARRGEAEQAMNQRTAVVLAAVRAETGRYRDLLAATAAGISTDDDLTWEHFDVATAPLANSNLAGAAGVAYVVPARTGELAATQLRWRGRGADGLTLRPAGAEAVHYFPVYTRTIDDGTDPLAGLDVRSSPEASAALSDARQLGRPTVSDPYVLPGDRGRPADRQQPSVVLAAPIWTRAPVPQFRGWLVAVLRGRDFLSGVLRAAGQDRLGARLSVTGAGGAEFTVAEYRVPGRPSLTRTTPVEVADQRWTLVTRADPEWLPGAYRPRPATVLAGCLAGTVLLAGLVHLLAAGRPRAGDRLRAATRRLRAAGPTAGQDGRRERILAGRTTVP